MIAFYLVFFNSIYTDMFHLTFAHKRVNNLTTLTTRPKRCLLCRFNTTYRIFLDDAQPRGLFAACAIMLYVSLFSTHWVIDCYMIFNTGNTGSWVKVDRFFLVSILQTVHVLAAIKYVCIFLRKPNYAPSKQDRNRNEYYWKRSSYNIMIYA